MRYGTPLVCRNHLQLGPDAAAQQRRAALAKAMGVRSLVLYAQNEIRECGKALAVLAELGDPPR